MAAHRPLGSLFFLLLSRLLAGGAKKKLPQGPAGPKKVARKPKKVALAGPQGLTSALEGSKLVSGGKAT
jgi:hypothetical protein